MNNRIKELYQKAHREYRIGYNASDINDTIMAYTTKRIFDYELFAELLIRDCADYAYSDDQDHKAMLKYFGVEEWAE